MGDLFRILAAAVLAVVFASSAATASADPRPAGSTPAAEVIRCPVMGEVVKDPSTAAKSVHQGKTYYFCCPGCKPKFDADPARYLGKASK